MWVTIKVKDQARFCSMQGWGDWYKGGIQVQAGNSGERYALGSADSQPANEAVITLHCCSAVLSYACSITHAGGASAHYFSVGS